MNLKLALAAVAALLLASTTQAITLADIAAKLASGRRNPAAAPSTVTRPVMVEAVSATMPTSIHSSIDPADIARVPAVLKADRYAIGMLKWTAPTGDAADPVVGYEAQPVSSNPVERIYPVTLPELPFNVGMLEVVAYQYWRVRTVFASGRRSAWNVSLTFPEKVTQAY